MKKESLHMGNAYLTIWLKRQLRQFIDKRKVKVESGSETLAHASLLGRTYGDGLIKATELLYYHDPNISNEFEDIIGELYPPITGSRDISQPDSQLGLSPADSAQTEIARETRKGKAEPLAAEP